VIRLLEGAGLLEEGRVRLLLSWRHTGFSVHNQVLVPPGDGRAIEALARYCLRTPVSLTRLCLTADSSTVKYLARDDLHSPGRKPAGAEGVVGVVVGQEDVTDGHGSRSLPSTSRAKTGAMKGSTRRAAVSPRIAVQLAP